MYRGEVSVPADKLKQLLKAAQMLQIHGLAACLQACLGAVEEDRQSERNEIPNAITKLSELNSELELRPLTTGASRQAAPRSPSPQRSIVKEEVEFIEEQPELSPIEIEPIIQIQSVFSSGQSTSDDKAENSDDAIEFEEGPMETLSQPKNNFKSLMRPLQGDPCSSSRPHDQPHRNVYQETCLYKKYSPRVLEQALRDLNSGRFRSIRACARHHGIPMTTLRYRAKLYPKHTQTSWLSS